MRNPFRRGVIAGLLAPLLFLAALVMWTYRGTKRVPFPVRRAEAGEVALRLVPPEQAPSLWEPWRQELTPLLDALRGLGDRVRRLYFPPK